MAHSAQDLDLAAIAIFTETGNTARLLSKYRPDAPIYAMSPFVEVVNRCMLLWGTLPIQCDRFQDTDKLVDMAEDMLEQGGFVQDAGCGGDCGGDGDADGRNEFYAAAFDRGSVRRGSRFQVQVLVRAGEPGSE